MKNPEDFLFVTNILQTFPKNANARGWAGGDKMGNQAMVSRYF